MKWTKREGVLGGLTGVVSAALIISACGGAAPAGQGDLLNIPNSYPDYYANYLNVSGEPDIGLMCIHGAALITSSRSDSAAAQPFPSLDHFCATQINSIFSRTGHS